MSEQRKNTQKVYGIEYLPRGWDANKIDEVYVCRKRAERRLQSLKATDSRFRFADVVVMTLVLTEVEETS
jgi:hypothetical protein